MLPNSFSQPRLLTDLMFHLPLRHSNTHTINYSFTQSRCFNSNCSTNHCFYTCRINSMHRLDCHLRTFLPFSEFRLFNGFILVFTRTWLRYVRVFAIAIPSVCRLSSVCLSVTLVHPTQGVEAFGKISSPLCTLAILWPPCKILRR